MLDYDFINLGIDFGGNGSAHSFSAAGLKNDYSKLTSLVTKKYKATGISPDELYALIDKFIQYVEEKYGMINAIYCDSAEQTLINRNKSNV